VTTGLIPIAAGALRPEHALGVDLYWGDDAAQRPALLCAAHQPLSLVQWRRIRELDGPQLYIYPANQPAYEQYLREHLDQWLYDERVPAALRAASLVDLIRDSLQAVARRTSIQELIRAAAELGQRAAGLLEADIIPLHQLVHVLQHDDRTFAHSANVALYAVTLARELGYSAGDLEQIAVGGLLHDVGKLSIDRRLIHNAQTLSAIERRTVQRHPLIGFRDLVQHADFSWGQLMMVYQHHEQPDGMGYPVGATLEDIHPWARICAVVDVFDALTGRRPNRRAFSPEYALAVQLRAAGRSFDIEVMRCWQTLVPMPSTN